MARTSSPVVALAGALLLGCSAGSLDVVGSSRAASPDSGIPELPEFRPKEATELCGNQLDDNHDGRVDENCPCDATIGHGQQSCYSGPVATRGRGPCRAGSQRCIGDQEFKSWGRCIDEVTPQPEVDGDGVDNDCDGQVDAPASCTERPNDAACSCALPWGGRLPHGGQVEAFASSNVPCGGACAKEARTCIDGALSGNGTNRTCSIAACPPCTPQPIVEPTPIMPGKHRCASCPDGTETSFTMSTTETARSFAGSVSGASGDGQFFAISASGQATSGTIPTNRQDGQYRVVIPLFCGAQLVKLVWTNCAGSLVLVYAVTTTNCLAADLRLTLTWDALGADWELHLIKPGGRINDNATDCTWTSCIGNAPDWGVVGDPADNPTKDVDNTGSFGPENIFLPRPQPGVYTVLVEHWGNGDPQSDGEVAINLQGRAPVVLRKQNLAPKHVWTAATITWPGGTITPTQADYDCTSQWAGGCRAAIP